MQHGAMKTSSVLTQWVVFIALCTLQLPILGLSYFACMNLSTFVNLRRENSLVQGDTLSMTKQGYK